ncbi:MAG: dTDP-4-amino-4,6-dideoxygalactose transaminase [Bacteroidia bacterium]|nr:dTDP-4-amino-4,6-dideoxygalactose transaminase [Bacteroidia bacterium]MDW8345459.1 dTDP-4-amino-4,6-dideoxygalactose transaminase [Bacteroidia bacterium]
MSIKIPFNKPYLCGNELKYIEQAVQSGKISGDGVFTKRCHEWFEQKYRFKKCFLTTSCTDALEMAAILINIQPGDEVIMPSYTFVSTANAFVLRGAKITFVDSSLYEPNMDISQIEPLITPKTKAIVVVHYAGVACDMDAVLHLAHKHNLYVIEDAAQAIDSYYKGRPLGSIGHLAAFSFHETKNIISGEGGMLVVNDDRFVKRAEIIREKGTNRSQFFRGEVDKYGWVDIGSSFLPSDIIAAFLYAQLEHIQDIQKQRKYIWDTYYTALKPLSEKGYFTLPYIPDYATNNYHMFYILCRNLEERTALTNYLKNKGILAVFHYLPLEQSVYYKDKHDGRTLPHSTRYADTLLRLPLYYELNDSNIKLITDSINEFFNTL